MTRLLYAALVAFALAAAAPAIAVDCPGDCTNCPHKAAEKGGKDAASCACSGGQACKCEKGCKCDHCSKKKDEKAPKAPAKG